MAASEMHAIERDREYLRRLELISGKKLTAIARELGMAPSTLTRVAREDATNSLGRRTIDKLKEAYGFEPGEDPPGPGAPQRPTGVSDYLPARPPPMPDRVVPVRQCSLTRVEVNGRQVEAIMVDTEGALRWLPKQASGGPGLYAIWMPTEAFAPIHAMGRAVFLDPDRPAAIGAQVLAIVEYFPHGHVGIAGTLTARTAEGITITPANGPALTFPPETRLHRAPHWDEVVIGA